MHLHPLTLQGEGDLLQGDAPGDAESTAEEAVEEAVEGVRFRCVAL